MNRTTNFKINSKKAETAVNGVDGVTRKIYYSFNNKNKSGIVTFCKDEINNVVHYFYKQTHHL